MDHGIHKMQQSLTQDLKNFLINLEQKTPNASQTPQLQPKSPDTWDNQCSVNFTHCGLVISYGNIELGQHWLI